jgi:hypothetical protein
MVVRFLGNANPIQNQFLFGLSNVLGGTTSPTYQLLRHSFKYCPHIFYDTYLCIPAHRCHSKPAKFNNYRAKSLHPFSSWFYGWDIWANRQPFRCQALDTGSTNHIYLALWYFSHGIFKLYQSFWRPNISATDSFNIAC